MLTWGVIYSSSGSELWFLQARAPNIYDIPCLHSRNLRLCKDQRAFGFLWNPNKTVTFFVEFQLLLKRLDSEWRFPPVWMPVTNWLPPKKSAPFKTLPGNLGKSTKLAFWAARDNFEQNLQWLSFCWELGPNWQFRAKSCKVCTHLACTDTHGKIIFFDTISFGGPAGAQAVRGWVRNFLP